MRIQRPRSRRIRSHRNGRRSRTARTNTGSEQLHVLCGYRAGCFPGSPGLERATGGHVIKECLDERGTLSARYRQLSHRWHAPASGTNDAWERDSGRGPGTTAQKPLVATYPRAVTTSSASWQRVARTRLGHTAGRPRRRSWGGGRGKEHELLSTGPQLGLARLQQRVRLGKGQVQRLAGDVPHAKPRLARVPAAEPQVHSPVPDRIRLHVLRRPLEVEAHRGTGLEKPRSRRGTASNIGEPK